MPQSANCCYSHVEPSIFINANDPAKVVAVSVMNDYYYSKDSGNTWHAKSMVSRFGVNGDPCLLVDQKGFYYYFHLSNLKGERHE